MEGLEKGVAEDGVDCQQEQEDVDIGLAVIMYSVDANIVAIAVHESFVIGEGSVTSSVRVLAGRSIDRPRHPLPSHPISQRSPQLS